MSSSFGCQLVYVLKPTSVSRIRATVVKKLNGTVYTVFLDQECRSLFTSCYSHFSHNADVGISRLAFNARTAWTDGKCLDCDTMIPWETGKQQVWDVMVVVDALAPSRLNQGSSCNPETNTTVAGERKIGKYCKLIDQGYTFEPVAIEVQDSLGESSEIFITHL